MLVQAIQVAGSLLILTAFVASQKGRLSPTSTPYLVLNLVGSAVLAVLAALHHEYGFLLLEGVWAIVSAAGVVAVVRGRTAHRVVGHG
jgi:hypothetical protein